jgi:hypothetical protein
MTLRRQRVRRLVALVAAWVLLLAGCGLGDDGDPAPQASAGSPAGQPSDEGSAPEGHGGHGLAATPTPTAEPRPLRGGEERVTLAMPAAYTPSAPYGVGTDDYRCFLLDPALERDVFLTGTNVLPGNPAVVHHVIMFRVPPDDVRIARQMDAAEEGEGWTCFGDVGFGDPTTALDDAQWLGAWAPGGKEAVAAPGYGTRLEKGSQVVMQVHYNLLAGEQPDISAMQLRLAPADSGLTELHTMLLPAPVELPCRAGRDDNPLCDRAAAVADVKTRFGARPGSTNDVLYFLCGGTPKPSRTASCQRPVGQPTTIRAVAGHMHLLGRSITIEVNPGTPGARTILDIPVWDFDNQGSRPIEPVELEPMDTLRVTCRHAQWLRDELPAFATEREDRYVVWGEGSTDEMCLGIVTVTRP